MTTAPQTTRHFQRLQEAADLVFERLGSNIKMATPLGLGKPNLLINQIYARAKSDPKISLDIYTALSLAVPKADGDLQNRFLAPFAKRHFGENYPELEYVNDRSQGNMPSNIRVREFYFQAAQNIGRENPQRDYVSLNYTHVTRFLIESELNVVVQLVAKRGNQYSLSCNPDLTLDLVDAYKAAGKPLMMIGVVHPEMPFLGSDAIVESSFFSGIVESPEMTGSLFAVPRTPVDLAEHWIGFHASRLVVDDGTLQIGIGALSDALVHKLILRHQHNSLYERWVSKWSQSHPDPRSLIFESSPFAIGLYGSSEMIMDGFMRLRQNGILKRQVQELHETVRRYLHGGFFLGSKDLYKWLGELSGEDFDGLNMTRISMINDLYDPHEMAIRRQRKRARFFNTCMSVSMLGGAASETLENGQVISGVGGQYNFVAMSQELADSRSALMLRSTRESKGKRKSNLVTHLGNQTIPRHLRDVVITEYGVAALHGKTDEECIQNLLAICDAEFQDGLIIESQKNKKLSQSYRPRDWMKKNTPQNLRELSQEFGLPSFAPAFPFGSDFTPTEERLAVALSALKSALPVPSRLLSLAWRGMQVPNAKYKAELVRLDLETSIHPVEVMTRLLVLGALETNPLI